MSSLAVISEMCDIINRLSDIVKRQKTEIERSKVEESIKEELRSMIRDTEKKMNVNECHLRHVVDTDDAENVGEETNDD